jgi:hypothetical protein
MRWFIILMAVVGLRLDPSAQTTAGSDGDLQLRRHSLAGVSPATSSIAPVTGPEPMNRTGMFWPDRGASPKVDDPPMATLMQQCHIHLLVIRTEPSELTSPLLCSDHAQDLQNRIEHNRQLSDGVTAAMPTQTAGWSR